MAELLAAPETFKSLAAVNEGGDFSAMRKYGMEIYKDDLIEFLLYFACLVLERHQVKSIPIPRI